jgi:hypothetical protein
MTAKKKLRQHPKPPTRSALARPTCSAITDTDRLNWLIQHSSLERTEKQEIELMVTQKAVFYCATTYDEKYAQQVRDAIDARMSPNSIIRPYSHAVLVPEKRPSSQGERRTAATLCQSQSQRVTRQIGTPHKT